MAVFVDPDLPWVRTRVWRWDSVSHMYADSPEELHALARRIGLRREWCSDHTQPDSRMLHYDLSPGMRRKAVGAGAVEVDHYHKFKQGYCPRSGREQDGIDDRRDRPQRRGGQDPGPACGRLVDPET